MKQDDNKLHVHFIGNVAKVKKQVLAMQLATIIIFSLIRCLSFTSFFWINFNENEHFWVVSKCAVVILKSFDEFFSTFQLYNISIQWL